MWVLKEIFSGRSIAGGASACMTATGLLQAERPSISGKERRMGRSFLMMGVENRDRRMERNRVLLRSSFYGKNSANLAVFWISRVGGLRVGLVST
jgi:hypothetical protein